MVKHYSLGYDIGSSSVKASLLDLETGETAASDFFPKTEMPIDARAPGWAEQDPNMWWQNLILATKSVVKKSGSTGRQISSIGISYQMHGLVMVDDKQNVIYPSIIWCDSRAVSTGESLLRKIELKYCCDMFLNVPGNFTLSKLMWIKDNDPSVFSRISKIMLPGDYIALRLTGEITTTIPGLSEGILWNFREKSLASELLELCGLDESLIPNLVGTFGVQGQLTPSAADATGLSAGIPITYRAGDQPNNAFSLNALRSDEFAATAGTSGVIYGVTKEKVSDSSLRLNTFAHVNYRISDPVYGLLLCINGAGRLNSWLKNSLFSSALSYDEMNILGAEIPAGCDGLIIHPFGNGTERMLKNINFAANISGLDFNQHGKKHIIRAAQEGIAFTFRYGLDLLKNLNLEPEIIRAGNSNLFLSELFSEIFANICNTPIEIYNTDGAQGAARGAAFGSGFYKSMDEAFENLKIIRSYGPESHLRHRYDKYYDIWKNQLRIRLEE